MASCVRRSAVGSEGAEAKIEAAAEERTLNSGTANRIYNAGVIDGLPNRGHVSPAMGGETHDAGALYVTLTSLVVGPPRVSPAGPS